MAREWTNIRLGEFLTLKRGYDLPAAERNESGGVPVISSSGVFAYHDTAIVAPPGIVTGRYGSVGAVFYIDVPFWPLNTTLYVEDFKGNDERFTYYLLQTLNFDQFSGKTSVPGVNRNDLHRIRIKRPPLAEQRRIAEILGAWDDAIALTGRLIDALKRRKQGLTEYLVTGAIRFQEFEGYQWEDLPIGSFLTESRILGGDGSRARKLTVKLYGKGIVEKEETRQGSENTQYYIRRSGQFIYSKLDFLNGAFGIVPEYLDGYGTTLDLPAFDIGNGLNPIYFLNYVSRENFYKRFLGIAVGGRKARRIQPSEFLSIRIPVPDVPEQDRIVAVLKTLEAELMSFEQYSEKLKQQKSGLMQRLLTGQIRVGV